MKKMIVAATMIGALFTATVAGAKQSPAKATKEVTKTEKTTETKAVKTVKTNKKIVTTKATEVKATKAAKPAVIKADAKKMTEAKK